MTIIREILAVIGALFVLSMIAAVIFIAIFSNRPAPRDGDPFADLDEERW